MIGRHDTGDADAAGRSSTGARAVLRVYVENSVVSARTRRDADALELSAIDWLFTLNESGDAGVRSSRQSIREIERAPARYQAELKGGLADVEIVRNDHVVLGFHNQSGPYGDSVSYPLVTDIVDRDLYSRLVAIGLKVDDAKHLMYACHNGCERFITLDSDFLADGRRSELESVCGGIRIQTPSELRAELSHS